MRRIVSVALLAPFLAANPSAATAQEKDAKEKAPANPAAEAKALYDSGDYARCGALYRLAAEDAARMVAATHHYNAACCEALAGHADGAFAALEKAFGSGWREVEHLRADADLASLYEDPRWFEALSKAAANQEAYEKAHNVELLRLYEADQADRGQGPEGIDWAQVGARDEARRERVLEMLEAGEVRSAEDHFHAAMIFQHGSSTEQYERAHRLAEKAVELDPEHTLARWLTAAARDRYLHSQSEPQIYGTQYRRGEDGLWSLDPIDPDAVTDAERAALGVPPLAASRKRAEAMNGDAP